MKLAFYFFVFLIKSWLIKMLEINSFSFILEKYTKLKQDEKEKKEDWELILKKMEEAQMSNSEKEIFKREILHKDAELLREK